MVKVFLRQRKARLKVKLQTRFLMVAALVVGLLRIRKHRNTARPNQKEYMVQMLDNYFNSIRIWHIKINHNILTQTIEQRNLLNLNFTIDAKYPKDKRKLEKRVA